MFDYGNGSDGALNVTSGFSYLPLLQEILGYLIVAIVFMLVGAFLQWDSSFFFNVGHIEGGA